MLERIGQVEADIPVSFIYGSRSSIDSDSGYALKKSRPDVEVTVSLLNVGGSQQGLVHSATHGCFCFVR